MKSRSFRERIGFALAGIRIAWRREKSFRSQCGFAVAAIAAVAVLRPGLVWAAIVVLTIGLVLLLELVNAALEYLTDRVHPELHEEIKYAKDAAAGAVLLASIAALCVGALMLASVAWERWLP